MKLEKLSAIAQILSAIAIVATLVYVAIQTQQTKSAIQASVRQSVLSADQTLLLYVADNPEIFEFPSQPDLTSLERTRLTSFLLVFMQIRQYYWLEFQSGLIDQETWDSHRAAALGVLSSPNARVWWNESAVPMGLGLKREFITEIDELLQDMPVEGALAPDRVE